MFIGADNAIFQPYFDKINDYGWDLGGTGPCARTAMSSVGAARCKNRVLMNMDYIVT